MQMTDKARLITGDDFARATARAMSKEPTASLLKEIPMMAIAFAQFSAEIIYELFSEEEGDK